MASLFTRLPDWAKRMPLLLIVLGLLALVMVRYVQLLNQPAMAQRQLPIAKVEVVTVQPESISRWVFSEGTIKAKRKAFLDFEYPGKVVAIGTQQDGTELRAGSRVFGPQGELNHGQLLAQIDSRDNSAVVTSLQSQLQAVAAQRRELEARLLQAQNERTLNQQNYQRMKEVHQRGLISQDEFDRVNTAWLNAQASVTAAESALAAIDSEAKSLSAELNRATISLEKTSLFAPFDGVISAMNIVEDNHYYLPMSAASDRERELSSAIVVVDDSELEVRLEIAGRDADLIEEGQTVWLASDDQQLYQAALQDGGEQDSEEQGSEAANVHQGRVWSVSPAFNLQQRSLTVKVRLSQQDGRLRDGQFVRVWIAAQNKPEVLALPLHALSFSGSEAFVFVVDEQMRVTIRDVELGIQGLNKVEVTNGLQVGDTVVTRGQHLLVEGAQVNLVER
ncbi:efflux RND transporter periplasmic adaptor subunit [Aliagarivorans taiwanensis]|uniref:efflux RND transporter periplasmic adaptor subunit n=1 Tax=Aliagarivorans taiwanensis TaxID=561966 RepID=UPI00040AE76C|nr:efflux RND transporter periplasmic adaptor subunit [Aliagarivorans taiwanensis]